MMNDDVERVLQNFAPRGAEAQVRQRVLDAVAGELSVGAGSVRQRRCGLAVAALLVLGIALNVWVAKASDYRLARLYGPKPVPRQIADVRETVQSVTDPQTGQWIQRSLLAARQSQAATDVQHLLSYRQMIYDLRLLTKERRDEDPQMDRNRGRRPDGHTLDHQRSSRLDYRFTA